MKNYTSLSQSKKLIELGLSPESADMFYSMRHREDYDDYDFLIPVPMPIAEYIEGQKAHCPTYCTDFEKLIPCWSTGQLYSLIPKEWHAFKKGLVNNNFFFSTFRTDGCVDFVSFRHDELIDNLCEAIAWCMEKGIM